jgi:hypothetical protein
LIGAVIDRYSDGRMRWVAALVLGSLSLAACATYQDELASGQRAFEANEHDRALAIFRVLEPDAVQLSVPDRARYAYLRGMTDFRIGYQAEARHWLSMAAVIEQAAPGSLPADWNKRLVDSLKELNEAVYTAGIESLSNAAPAKAKPADDSSETPAEPAPAPKN